jgi:hypothetical protein
MRPMADEEEDWRLGLGEAEWMYGAKLQRRVFTAPTRDWDHEHCVLCQAKFMELPHEDVLHEGLVSGYDRSHDLPPMESRLGERPDAPGGFRTSVETPTHEQWICEQCFEDFKERFRWSVVAQDDLIRRDDQA